MRAPLLIATAALALIAAGCATMDGDVDNDFGTFETWDTDRDGVIDNDEWGVGFDNYGIYDRWDMDRSGFLENDEWDDDWGAFDTFDEDDSLGVDEDEFETGLFDTWDGDDFGIDMNEWDDGIGMF